MHDLYPHHSGCWASTKLSAESLTDTHRAGHVVHLAIQSPPHGSPLWLFKWDTHSFHNLRSPWKFHPHTSLRILCHQTFVFSWVPNISDKLPVAVHESVYLHFRPSLNPDKVDNQMHRSKSCPLGEFSITTVLLGHPWMNGVVLLQHPLPVDANILCKTICKLGLSFFFLSQLRCLGTPRWGHRLVERQQHAGVGAAGDRATSHVTRLFPQELPAPNTISTWCWIADVFTQPCTLVGKKTFSSSLEVQITWSLDVPDQKFNL